MFKKLSGKQKIGIIAAFFIVITLATYGLFTPGFYFDYLKIHFPASMKRTDFGIDPMHSQNAASISAQYESSQDMPTTANAARESIEQSGFRVHSLYKDGNHWYFYATKDNSNVTVQVDIGQAFTGTRVWLTVYSEYDRENIPG